jgi:hypothetical protein
VRCVAEQRYAPFGPPLQWFAVVERPALGLGCRNNKLAQTTVPSLELAQKIRDFSVIRPRLCPTISGGGDGDKVHELPARDRVVDEMASRAEPKGLHGPTSHLRGVGCRNQTAKGAKAGEAWLDVRDHVVPDKRMDAVRASCDIRRYPRLPSGTIDKSKLDFVV